MVLLAPPRPDHAPPARRRGRSVRALVIAVAVFGLFIAIAFPVLAAVQERSQERAADSVAAQAVTQVSAQLSQGRAASVDDLLTDATTAIAVFGNDDMDLDSLCAVATVGGSTRAAGHGVSDDGGSCIPAVSIAIAERARVSPHG